MVGSSEDGLRLRLRLSLVPGRTRPTSGGAFAPCLGAVGRDFGCGWRRSSFVRYRRGSSSPSVVAVGSVIDLPHLLRLGMGRAQSEIAFFTPTTVSSRWRLRRWMTGTMATAARRTAATSEDGGRPCRRSRPLRRRLLHKLIHNTNR
jgi:hypothetical protein